MKIDSTLFYNTLASSSNSIIVANSDAEMSDLDKLRAENQKSRITVKESPLKIMKNMKSSFSSYSILCISFFPHFPHFCDSLLSNLVTEKPCPGFQKDWNCSL